MSTEESWEGGVGSSGVSFVMFLCRTDPKDEMRCDLSELDTLHAVVRQSDPCERKGRSGKFSERPIVRATSQHPGTSAMASDHFSARACPFTQIDVSVRILSSMHCCNALKSEDERDESILLI